MATVDELLIKIDATTESLRRELKRAEQQVTQSSNKMERDVAGIDRAMAGFDRTMRRVTQILGVFGVALGVRALTQWTRSALDAAGGLGELSQQLGVATDNLQVYQYAASQAGLSSAELEAGLMRLSRSIGEAATGTKQYADAFALVGVSITTASGQLKSTDQVLVELAEGLSRIEDPAARASIAADLLGRNGQKLLPILEQGAAGIDAFARRARELGVVLSAEEIAAADRAADKWAEFGFVLEKIGQKVLIETAPAIEDLFDTLNQPEVVSGITTLIQGLAAVVEVAAESLAFIVNVLRDLYEALRETGLVLREFFGMSSYADGGVFVGLADQITAATEATGGLTSASTAAGEALAGAAGKGEDAYQALVQQMENAISLLDEELALQGESEQKRAVELRLTQELQRLRAAGLKLYEGQSVEMDRQIEYLRLLITQEEERKAQIEGIEEAQKAAAERADEAAEAAKRRAEDFHREIESVATSIADDLTDALFEGAEDGFDNIFQNLGKWLQRIALEVLQQQIVLPVTMQLVGAVPGLFGISGGGGAGGNGFNLVGALGDTATQIGTWLGLGGSAANGTSAALGLVPGGSAVTTATSGFDFAGLLGDAALGAGIGQVLASITGGGSTGATIGGGLGSIIGSGVGGPIGSVVGGLLGGFIGSLFGGAPERIGPQSIFEIRGAGGLGPQQIAATQGAGDPSEFGNSIIATVENLVAALGGTLGGGRVTTDVGFIEALGGLYVNPTGHYGTAGSGVQAGGTFFGNDAEAARRFAVSTILSQAGVAGVDPAAVAALKRSLAIRDDDTEVEKDLGVINLLFAEAAEEMGEAERALRDLNEQMDDAAKRAKELGLAEADVEAKRAEAIAALKSGFLTSLEDQILALKDPVAFAIQELDRWYEAMIADAEALGVGLAEVEELYGLRRQEILERIGQQSVDSLQRFLEQITFGNLSGAAPGDVLAGSRAAFEAAAAQALAGDLEARARIQDLGSQFLDASRAFNASGSAFYTDRARVEEVVRALLGEAPGYAQGTLSAPGGWSWVGERGRELMFTPPGAAILPNAISEMVAGVANRGGAGAGRDLLKVASQQLAEMREIRARLGRQDDALGRLVSRLDRLDARLPEVA